MPTRALLASVSLLAIAGSAYADLPRTPPPAENFTVSVEAPPSKAGAAATAKVSVKPAAGFHFNKEFPTSLKLVAPEGVALTKENMTKADGKVEEAGASFDVVYTAKAAGKKTINGTLKFAVCTASTCDPRTAKVAINVDVK